MEANYEMIQDLQMADIVENYLSQQEEEGEALLEDLGYSDVFPEDLSARPNSFEALLLDEISKLKKGEIMEDAYQRARAREAFLDAESAGEEGEEN